MYMMNPTFERSGSDCSLAFHTSSLGVNALRYSWKYLLKLLESSGDLLRRILMFMFWGLAWGVPLPSHFLKVVQSSSAIPLIHERPSVYFLGYLYRGGLV